MLIRRRIPWRPALSWCYCLTPTQHLNWTAGNCRNQVGAFGRWTSPEGRATPSG
jgi:hypothetical protein